MSAKGGVGMRIDLDKVPTRQKNMKTWELLLSESQERMLLVALKGKEQEVKKVFEKWDLPCSVIGEVTEDGLLDFYRNGQLEASIPAHELVLGGGAPQYERGYSEPAYFAEIKKFNRDKIPVPEDIKTVAEQILQLPSIASKRWVYHQYDSMVGTNNTSTNAPADAAVVLVKGTKKGIAITTDCNSRYVFADPYKGAMIAVSEAARNIVCSGGQPLGVTNCLNFGNPYDPEVYYQFVHAVKGMGEACRKFETPVTGGNVSFYNQNPDGPVYPTPTIGMVGLLEDVNKKMTLDFKNDGDHIFLIGEWVNDIGSSQYLAKLCGVEFSPAPHFDLEKEFHLQKVVMGLIENGDIQSAHDVSEGGLMTTLFEKGFSRELGFSVSTIAEAYREGSPVRIDAFWFGEAQSRVLVSVAENQLANFHRHMEKCEIAYAKLGTVTTGEIVVDGEHWGTIDQWMEKYDTAIENFLSKEEAGSALSSI
jgi:phosphoribosylformylglycinamidine synthase